MKYLVILFVNAFMLYLFFSKNVFGGCVDGGTWGHCVEYVGSPWAINCLSFNGTLSNGEIAKTGIIYKGIIFNIISILLINILLLITMKVIKIKFLMKRSVTVTSWIFFIIIYGYLYVFIFLGRFTDIIN